MYKYGYLIAPSWNCDKKTLKDALNFLNKINISPIYRRDINSKSHSYSGDMSRRAGEINQAYANKKAGIIFSIQGGYGATQIINKLDYNLIKKSKKVIVGSSDITIILNSIFKKTNSRCIHGPNLNKNFKEFDKKTLDSLIDAISKKNYAVRFNQDDIIVKGISKAEIIGGNLSLIERSIGTEFEVDTKGRILFLEDVRLKEGYLLDLLWHLKLAGKFDKVKGIILGSFNDCGIYVNESLRIFFNNFKVPVIFNQPIGHTEPNISVPLGEICTIDTDKKTWKINFD